MQSYKKKKIIKLFLKYLHIFSFAVPFDFYKICDVMHYKAIQIIKHTIFDAQSKINGKTFGCIRLF